MFALNRRRSARLRLMLAAVALLGIGAAITAAAWEDRVHFEINANAADFNLQGRVATIEGIWGEWLESNDGGAIELTVAFSDMAPNDSRTFWLQVRNSGDLDAFITGDLALDSADPGCSPALAISPEDGEDFLAAGATSQVYAFTFTTGSWEGCQGWSGTFTLTVTGSTDEPADP